MKTSCFVTTAWPPQEAQPHTALDRRPLVASSVFRGRLSCTVVDCLAPVICLLLHQHNIYQCCLLLVAERRGASLAWLIYSGRLVLRIILDSRSRLPILKTSRPSLVIATATF